MQHLIHFLKDLKNVGAIAPSSRFLARNLVKQFRQDIRQKKCSPLNILEIGAGTGPLTKEITQDLRDQDIFNIVEINDHFYQTINKKFNRSNITVYHQDILNHQPGIKYDYIFSSLPYEAMSEQLIEDIWTKKLDLCKEQAYICYFKYVSFRKFKCDFEEKLVKQFQHRKKIVLRNLPPAKLFTLEIDGQHHSIDSVMQSVA